MRIYSEANLRAEMARRNVTQAQLAKALDLSRATISAKIHSGKFGIDEVNKIADFLELSKPEEIFFAEA